MFFFAVRVTNSWLLSIEDNKRFEELKKKIVESVTVMDGGSLRVTSIAMFFFRLLCTHYSRTVVRLRNTFKRLTFRLLFLFPAVQSRRSTFIPFFARHNASIWTSIPPMIRILIAFVLSAIGLFSNRLSAIAVPTPVLVRGVIRMKCRTDLWISRRCRKQINRLIESSRLLSRGDCIERSVPSYTRSADRPQTDDVRE